MKINNYEVVLKNTEFGQGLITIFAPNGDKYEYYWCAMNSNIETFLQQIDSEYFVNKLLPSDKMYVTNWNKTFTNVRNYIRDEIGLKWYEHQNFQKHLRANISEFKNWCKDVNNERYFVDTFHNYLYEYLNWHLMDYDVYSTNYYQKEFENISEVWYFLAKSKSKEYKDLIGLHKLLKQKLSKM
jgi:hypothetical protein